MTSDIRCVGLMGFSIRHWPQGKFRGTASMKEGEMTMGFQEGLLHQVVQSSFRHDVVARLRRVVVDGQLQFA